MNEPDSVPYGAVRYFVLIPAAGVGTRMQMELPKQYATLLGRPILWHAISAFLRVPCIAHVFVVTAPGDRHAGAVAALFDGDDAQRITFLDCGGSTRKETVKNALFAMAKTCLPNDMVLVHDAARPGITPDLVERLVFSVGSRPEGGLLALPVADTVKHMDTQRVRTIPRDGLWLAQTPQMFSHGLLTRALETQSPVTDEASAVEALGISPMLVQGHLCNTKVTRPDDLMVVCALMEMNDRQEKK